MSSAVLDWGLGIVYLGLFCYLLLWLIRAAAAGFSHRRSERCRMDGSTEGKPGGEVAQR
jgi:hypothetical protein